MSTTPTPTRRPVHFNAAAQPRVISPSPSSSDAVLQYHAQLAGYQRTALAALPDLAGELGVRAVHVKDESARLGLPSFKMLGAS
ncbi:hypothetical protein F4775DRAFT_566986, partial [Biscogniauxia sp. FL1348]